MSVEWYIEYGDKEYGPATSAQLLEYLAAGKLQRDWFVKLGRDGSWQTLGEVERLVRAHADPAAAVGAPPPAKRGDLALPPLPTEAIDRAASLEEQLWFLYQGGAQWGPLNFAELCRLAASGSLSSGDLVWTAGLPQWQPAAQIESLPFPPPAPAASAGPAPCAPPTDRAPRAAPAPSAARSPVALGSPGPAADRARELRPLLELLLIETSGMPVQPAIPRRPTPAKGQQTPMSGSMAVGLVAAVALGLLALAAGVILLATLLRGPARRSAVDGPLPMPQAAAPQAPAAAGRG
jgi:hypothetical protein